jgi:hypothetical protein
VANSYGRAQTRHTSISLRCSSVEAERVEEPLQGMHQWQRPYL